MKRFFLLVLAILALAVGAGATTQYTLTVATTGSGTSTPTTGTVDSGVSTAITATANAGYYFAKWTTTGSGAIANASQDSTSVIVTGNATVTANFQNYSILGIDWRETRMTGGHQWNGICYDSTIKKWVMVNGGNVQPARAECAVSSDLKNWTFGTIAGMTYPFRVTYGNGICVCVGYDGKISTSTDGLTWSVKYTSPDTAIFYDVKWGDTVFVADAIGTHAWDTHGPNWVMTSPTGTTWTKRTLPDSIRAGNLCYGNHFWIITCVDSGSIWTSPNSVNWTKSSSLPFHLYATTAPCYGVDNHGRGIYILKATLGTEYSYNGTTWSYTGSGAIPYATGYTAFGGGLFTCVNYVERSGSLSGANVQTSVDGINWVKRVSDTLVCPWTVAYGNGSFAIVSLNEDAGFMLGLDTSAIFVSSNFHPAFANASFEIPFTVNPAFVSNNDSISFPIRLNKITSDSFWTNIYSDTNIAVLDARGNIIRKYGDSLSTTNKLGTITIRAAFDTTIPNIYYLAYGKKVGNKDSAQVFPTTCADRFSFDETTGKAVNTIRSYYLSAVGAISRVLSWLNNGSTLTGTNYHADSTANVMNYNYNQKWAIRQVYKDHSLDNVNSGYFMKSTVHIQPGIEVYTGGGLLYCLEVPASGVGDRWSFDLAWTPDTTNYHVMTLNNNGTWGGLTLYLDGVKQIVTSLTTGTAGSILNAGYFQVGNITGLSSKKEIVDEVQIFNDTISTKQIATWSNLVLNDTAITFGSITPVNSSTGGNGGLVGGLAGVFAAGAFLYAFRKKIFRGGAFK